ncbi:GntR family transcriptional regulator [Nonomuraea fuscirosea]|uniref:GntR family transcriptional regulator n=1 Tax=Nonomuraea fuscirosea TaxID=1291556 RepID=A0A2T0LZR2_9ACTN|nr:GntR family transcriptional regulator [Nonomuraea fuscirosea]PRX49697.1 GntR family transcriptional regulator [Nonomuraea fuscirosea]
MVQYQDTRPKHQQIAAAIRADIMAGRLSPGAQLPSTQQLVSQYTTANATVQRALSLLKDEGFLEGRPGKGVFVRAKQLAVVEVSSYFAPSPRGYSYELLSVDEVVPPPDVAQALGLDDGDKAVLRHRLLLHDGDPVELSWSYYPSTLVRGTPLAGSKKIKGGAPQVLTDLGYPQREFTDLLSSRPPTVEEAEGLELPEGVPVMRQFRVVYAENKRPVEVSVLVKGGHLYTLQYHQRTT